MDHLAGVGPGGVGEKSLLGRPAHSEKSGSVLGQFEDVRGQRARIAGRDQKPVFTLDDNFFRPSPLGGNGRQAKSHTLHIADPESLQRRRDDQDVAVLKKGGQMGIADLAQHRNPIDDSGIGYLFAEGHRIAGIPILIPGNG